MPRIPLLPEPTGTELLELTEPPDWDAVFGMGGPLELEIGSGKGGHALAYCARFPERRLVAFEWRRKYARDTAEKAKQRGMRNLKVLEGDARRHVPLLFRPGSLSVVHLQFPDPWWKVRHQKRAIVQDEFARLLLERMVPGGLFDLRTDVRDRAEAMLATLEEVGFVNPLGAGAFHPYDPEEVPSSRERRYIAAGEPVYRARLRKPE
ncbi:MAG: tRNA (guanosine(46)-N7)-methyltransferase TrmB [Myxococcaceae bacterium]|nr:tRNA (guanosine(46)-N7)-methyltransferase TrmB [Myxococcaceae bacterium]